MCRTVWRWYDLRDFPFTVSLSVLLYYQWKEEGAWTRAAGGWGAHPARPGLALWSWASQGTSLEPQLPAAKWGTVLRHLLANGAAVGLFLPDSGDVIQALSAGRPPAQPEDEPWAGAWEMGDSRGPAATETTRDLTTCHLATWQATCPRASRTSAAKEGLTRESRNGPSSSKANSLRAVRGRWDLMGEELLIQRSWESRLTGAFSPAGPPQILPGVSFLVCPALLVQKGSHTHSTLEHFWRCFNQRCFVILTPAPETHGLWQLQAHGASGTAWFSLWLALLSPQPRMSHTPSLLLLWTPLTATPIL